MDSPLSGQVLEEYAGRFVGHAIGRVRYLGWWKEAPEEPGAYLEYVELTMDDGSALRVTTDPDDLGMYGISIYEGAYPDPADAIHALDASDRHGWRELVGRSVSSASIGWAEIEATRVRTDGWPSKPVSIHAERVPVPCELVLRFNGGSSVLLTAAAWRIEGTLDTDSDSVAVVFGDADAERLGLGRWRAGALP